MIDRCTAFWIAMAATSTIPVTTACQLKASRGHGKLERDLVNSAAPPAVARRIPGLDCTECLAAGRPDG
jgi:hypothetical protein